MVVGEGGDTIVCAHKKVPSPMRVEGKGDTQRQISGTQLRSINQYYYFSVNKLSVPALLVCVL